MATEQKKAAVAELAASLRNANATVLTEYRGLTVAQLKELRRSLGDNANYAVVKNTLTKLAVRDAGIEGVDELLVGPTALAFVMGDPVEAAKGLKTFAKDNPALVIKGGVLEGKVLTPAEISKLAELESREVLLAKLAGGMKASLSQAAGLFAAPASSLARVLGALSAKAAQDPSVIGGAGEAAAGSESAAEEEEPVASESSDEGAAAEADAGAQASDEASAQAGDQASDEASDEAPSGDAE